MKTTQKHVQAGANLLDDHWPGWAGKIKPDEIKMFSNQNCIMGQLARTKKKTCRVLAAEYGIGNDSLVRFGFEGDGSEHDEQIANWWREEIKKRLVGPTINELDGSPKNAKARKKPTNSVKKVAKKR
jgi:hypothetical protein